MNLEMSKWEFKLMVCCLAVFILVFGTLAYALPHYFGVYFFEGSAKTSEYDRGFMFAVFLWATTLVLKCEYEGSVFEQKPPKKRFSYEEM